MERKPFRDFPEDARVLAVIRIHQADIECVLVGRLHADQWMVNPADYERNIP